MKKIKLDVPSGIKYLSDWDELENLLPDDQPFILNKRIIRKSKCSRVSK